MNIITLDFETFFSDDYTLKKMTTEAYVRDPRFEAHGCGFLVNGKSTYVEGHENVGKALQGFDWRSTALLCHHAHFDGLILSHHFGVRPAFWFDTMCMSRLVLGPTFSVALGALTKTFQLTGEKTVPYDRITGKRFADMSSDLRRDLAIGCLDDVRLEWELFQKLLPVFPHEELKIIDMTVRWFTEPVIEGDVPHYEWLKDKEWLTKNEMLYELGVSEKELGSNARFAQLLENEAVTTQMKDGKNGPIPAYAKTDEFMQSLLEHINPRVVALAEARLAIKSSIDETRAGRLAGMAKRGPMPIYLNYCGAGNTLRWSGGDSVNWQNFRRAGELRKGLVAPDGCLFGTVDKSQVECRFLNYLAGEKDDIKRFRSGSDPYLPIASQFYGREITKEHKAERGLGKQLILSCGYGAGGASICATAKRGAYGPPLTLSQEQGKAAANLYRTTHPGVTDFWRQGDIALAMLKNGYEDKVWKGVLQIKGRRLYGPNGAWLTYYIEERDGQFYRKVRNGWAPIWGGTMVQNICEFLCRIDLAQGMLRLRAQGIKVVASIHDEIWCIYPEEEAKAQHAIALQVMAQAPSWLPGIPLAAEGHLGRGYDK